MADENKCINCTNSKCLLNQHGTNKEFDILDKGKTSLHLQKNQQLSIDDTKNAGIYILKSGIAKRYALVKNKPFTFKFLKKGDVLNYVRDVVDSELKKHEETSLYSIKALTEISVCFIPSTIFQKILHQNPKLAVCFLFYFAEELNKADSKLVSLTLPAEMKIAKILFSICDIFELPKNNMYLPPEITRNEIAEASSTSIETVSKTLSALSKKGIIKKQGRIIQIINKKDYEQVLRKNRSN